MVDFILRFDFDKKIEIDQDSIYFLVVGGEFFKNPPIGDILINHTQLPKAYFIFKKVGCGSSLYSKHMDIIVSADRITYIESETINLKES